MSDFNRGWSLAWQILAGIALAIATKNGMYGCALYFTLTALHQLIHALCLVIKENKQ